MFVPCPRPALLVLLCLCATASMATASTLESRLDAATAEGRFDDALALADTLAYERHGAYVEALLDIVRLHCRKGDVEAAYAALDDLLEADYWNFRALREDETIDLIRHEERFTAAIRGAWAKQYLSMLERDSRAEMQLPQEILATLAFRPGERVADVGAGSGYFTLPIARAVGPTGSVLATDIRQEMLDYIANRLDDEKIDNVRLLKVEPEHPGLPASSLDTILMVDVYHYIKDRTAYARGLHEALAPGGRLVVIDFRYDPNAVREFAPPIQQQVARADLDADLAAAGFTVRAAYDFLPEQYFVVYEAK